MKQTITNSVQTMVLKSLFTILLSIFTLNFSYSQWNQIGTLSNIGSFPSVSMVTDNLYFVAGGPSGTPVIYKTTNGGSSYIQLNTTGISLELYCIWAVDENTIYVGNGGAAGGAGGNASVYKTTNGGTTWTNIFSTGGTGGFINGIVFSRSNPLIGIIQSDPPSGVGNPFMLAKTTNGGLNWTISNPPGVTGNASAQNSVFIIDENFYGFGLNLSPQMRYTTNGGTTWLSKTLTGAQGPSGFVTSIAFNNDKLNGVAAGYGTYNSVSRTTDGGNTWFSQAIPSTVPNGNNFGEVKWIPGYNTVYLIVSSSTQTQSFKSEDNGATWMSITFPNNGGMTHMDAINFFSTSQLTSVSSSGSVFKISDSPMPVEMLAFTSNVTGRDAKLSWTTASEKNNNGFEIYRTKTSDNKWEKIGFVKGNNNTSSAKTYTFSDTKLNAGKYNYKLKQIDNNGNYEYFTLNGTVEIGMPGKYNLSQNYPNPFNPVTKVDYDLPSDSKVSIKVYDMSGRMVMDLVNANQTAGNYSISLNANNLSSGTYFYRLIAKASNGNETVISKKMTVIK